MHHLVFIIQVKTHVAIQTRTHLLARIPGLSLYLLTWSHHWVTIATTKHCRVRNELIESANLHEVAQEYEQTF